MVNVAIIDDDSDFSNTILDFIGRYASDRGRNLQADAFSDAFDFVNNYNFHYDAIFLDISMPRLNGMDAAKRIRSVDSMVCIVFTTNMAQYAIQGYEVDAVGYLVKPIDYFSFSVIMDKVYAKIQSRIEEEMVVGTGKTSIQRISLRELYYVEVMDHYLIYHTSKGEYKELGRLNDVERQLEGKGFFRCNYSFLVNLRHILSMEDCTLTVGGDEIQISRRRRRDFLVALNDYLGGRVNGADL